MDKSMLRITSFHALFILLSALSTKNPTTYLPTSHTNIKYYNDDILFSLLDVRETVCG
jgi:hypothetical protein